MGTVTNFLTLLFLLSGANVKLVKGDCINDYQEIHEINLFTIGNICTDIIADDKNIVQIPDYTHALTIKNSYIPILSQSIFEESEEYYNTMLQYLYLNENNISHIDSNAFLHMPNIKVLNLSHNKLINIGQNALNGSFVWINLSNNNLSKLEYVTNSKLEGLIVRNNQITTIRETEFKGVDLIKLDLSNNYINTMNIINEIDTLETLNLSSNLINNIVTNDLHKLKSLVLLDLSNNQIKSVSENAFKNLNNLAHLYLENNNLQVFTWLEHNKIDNLVLSNNYLLTINCLHMQGHVMLAMNFLTTICHFGENTTHINLSTNAIMEIKNNTFTHIKKLIDLDLSENAISEIKVDAFKNLKTLKILKLNHNLISHIEMGTFLDLNNVESLDLSSNKISTLEIGIFTGLDNLTTLNLSNNLIEYIHNEIFYAVRNLNKLYLHKNPLITFDHPDYLSLVELSVSYAKIGCKALKGKLDEMSDLRMIEGHEKDRPNVHGIACDPNNKEVQYKYSRTAEAEYFMNHLLTERSMFYLTIVLFIVLFLSLTVSWLHKRRLNKVNSTTNGEYSLNMIYNNDE